VSVRTVAGPVVARGASIHRGGVAEWRCCVGLRVRGDSEWPATASGSEVFHMAPRRDVPNTVAPLPAGLAEYPDQREGHHAGGNAMPKLCDWEQCAPYLQTTVGSSPALSFNRCP
jgi:hypothetical protein